MMPRLQAGLQVRLPDGKSARFHARRFHAPTLWDVITWPFTAFTQSEPRKTRKPHNWFPGCELMKDGPRSDLLALFERAQARVNRVLTEQLFDAQKLVVFRQTIRAAQGTGLDLAAVRGHGYVGDGCVLGFAGAVREDGGVAVELRELHGVERLGKRTNLVHFHKNGIRGAGIN